MVKLSGELGTRQGVHILQNAKDLLGVPDLGTSLVNRRHDGRVTHVSHEHVGLHDAFSLVLQTTTHATATHTHNRGTHTASVDTHSISRHTHNISRHTQQQHTCTHTMNAPRAG
jgi:hypothetical protein